MDCKEYRQRGKEMVDYIADYLENIRERRVFPDVKPGYMKNLLPDSAPIEGEQWDAIFSDVERVIMPGITHWQSPHMHAYFPALNSYPSLLGDMLADAINCLGFTWASSPACTELEIIVMNWLGKMINLPDDFLHLSSSSRGGGVVQTTASEATLVCLLAGRTRAIKRFHEKRPGYQDAEINARLVAYCSDQAHSGVEKAALIGLVRMRYIEADENLSMRGQPLKEAIEDDIRQGLVPFWVCATLGTTGSCSFDNLEEVGIVCRDYNLWLHIDAAYAGSAFICPEYRTWLKGIEHADSIAFNPSKWLMIHFDATALWVKDSIAVHRTFNVEPLYLQHENSGVAVDFMHWQIPLSRRFRALKIWFVLRSFGIKGLQRHIREGVRLAQKFEALVLADHRFEIPAKRHLGLVVFRIKGDNEITERLLKRLNHRGNLHCIPSSLKGKYVIRFTVTSTHTTVDDILRDWMEIKNSASAILNEMNITISNRVHLKDANEKCEGFGSSLLLSNSPLSPKIVNGSFAAIFDADEFLAKTYAGIRIAHQESPSMRRRVRGILMSGKQFSLDSHMDVVVQTAMPSNTTNSKGMDCYGKTTGHFKSDERDAICEDEESLEDCEMNWILNTALQLSPKYLYLPILTSQILPPLDITQHQNNLLALKKYASKCDRKNFTTKSVNSVRTPLTQYQLFKCPRQQSLYTKHKHEGATTDLYPGKRYLNLDLNLYNDSIFTDTIYNLPTPTDDIIPIIITPDSPTTSKNNLIQQIEDFHKLRPPNLMPIITNANDTESDTAKRAEILKKLPPPNIRLIPKPKILNFMQDNSDATTNRAVFNETFSNFLLKKNTVKSFAVLEEEVTKDINIEPQKSLLLMEGSIQTIKSFNTNEKCSNENSKITENLSTELENFAEFKTTNKESDDTQTTKSTVSETTKDTFDITQQPTNISEHATTASEKSNTLTHKSVAEPVDSSTIVEVSNNGNKKLLPLPPPPPIPSFLFKSLEESKQSTKSSSITEENVSIEVEVGELKADSIMKPKIFICKSKDDSSSSDEFLESIRQPLNNSEGSSSASSSLELM